MVYGREEEPMTGRTWVVVADSHHANIYLRKQRNSALKPVTRLQDPVADPGTQEAAANGASAAKPANGSTPFAREVCGTLERGRNRGAFDELILIAPPRLLGTMREVLTKPTLGRVSREIPKNLIHCEPDRLSTYLHD